MSKLRPLVALMTDFGTRDPYVAAVKGVIAMHADCDIVDLTHEIAPFDAFEAAWFLKSVVANFAGERRVVFACVVDPGVGTSRRIILAERANQFFLAPDNGLLTFVVSEGTTIRSVENRSLFLPEGSSTFHGRDRFATVAAALANGLAAEETGPAIEEIVKLDYEPPSYGEIVRGTIVSIDHFGNAVSDIEPSRAGDLAQWIATVGWASVTRTAATFGDAPDDEPFFYAGSRGTIEVAIREKSAADQLHLAPRTSITLTKRK